MKDNQTKANLMTDETMTDFLKTTDMIFKVSNNYHKEIIFSLIHHLCTGTLLKISNTGPL